MDVDWHQIQYMGQSCLQPNSLYIQNNITLKNRVLENSKDIPA